MAKGNGLNHSPAGHELEFTNSLLRIGAKGIASWAEVKGGKSAQCEFFELGDNDEWTLTGELKGYVKTK